MYANQVIWLFIARTCIQTTPYHLLPPLKTHPHGCHTCDARFWRTRHVFLLHCHFVVCHQPIVNQTFIRFLYWKKEIDVDCCFAWTRSQQFFLYRFFLRWSEPTSIFFLSAHAIESSPMTISKWDKMHSETLCCWYFTNSSGNNLEWKIGLTHTPCHHWILLALSYHNAVMM